MTASLQAAAAQELEEEDLWEAGGETESGFHATCENGIVLGKVLPGLFGEDSYPGIIDGDTQSFLMEHMGAKLDIG